MLNRRWGGINQNFNIVTDSIFFTINFINSGISPISGDMIYENNDIMLYENNDTMIY